MSQHSYYDRAYRVMRDGAPMRVFHKGRTDHRAMIAIAAETGTALELDDCPQFRFSPAGDALAKAGAYRSSYRPPITTGTALADYYKGKRRTRRLVGGVPIMLPGPVGNGSHLAGWASLSAPMENWEGRAEQFRADLVRRGRYASAGVEPPAPQPERQREFTTRRAAERVAALLRAADGLSRDVQRVGGMKRRYRVAA